MEKITESSNSPGVVKQKGNAMLGHLLQDLPHMLAFFQFLFLYLPFGFINIVGVNLPYTDNGFLAGMIILLIAPGFIFGLICVLLIKLQRQSGPPGSWAFFEQRPLILNVISYTCAILSLIVYFVELNGWLSEIGPMMVYFAGMIASGTLAMLGLMAKPTAKRDRVPDASVPIVIIIIGSFWLLSSMLNLQWLMIANMIIAISIPPIEALGHLERESIAAEEEPQIMSKTFAWCDKFLATGDGPRAWMGTAIMLVLAVATAYMFSVIFYFEVPVYAFGFQVFMFFIGTSVTFLASVVIFKNRVVDILIIVILGIMTALLIIGDFVPGFAFTPLALLLDGICEGGALTLLFKLQDTRNDSSRLKDFAGDRIIEIFYYIFIAAVFGLLFSIYIGNMSLKSLFKKDIVGILPTRSVLGGLLLGLAVIILLIFNLNTQYLIKLERGEVAKKAESMEELMGGGKKDEKPAKQDAMVTAFLSGGGSKKDKEKKKAETKSESKKEPDAMTAEFLGKISSTISKEKQNAEPKEIPASDEESKSGNEQDRTPEESTETQPSKEPDHDKDDDEPFGLDLKLPE